MNKSKKKGIGIGTGKKKVLGETVKANSGGSNTVPNPYSQPQPYTYPRQDGMTAKEKVQYSLFGIIVVGGAVIIGRKWVKKAVSGNEQQKTLEDGSIATYAKQIKMAFDNDGWWGTNTGALRDVVRQIPDKSSFDKVMTSYQRLYSSSLLGDMQKALKSTEYNEMLAIVSAKPDRNKGSNNQSSLPGQSATSKQLQEWAKRLKAAFDIKYGIFPGTDNDAIKAVFLEIPTQAVFEQLKQTYQTIYGNELLKDLKSELEFWEYDPMMQLIFSKPNV